MKNLTAFTFIAETSLGSIALGSLWLSPWPLLIKISLSCVILLLPLSQDLQGLERSMQAEQQLEFFDLGIRAIEQRLIGNEVPSFSELCAEHLKQKALKMRISGNGFSYVLSLLAKYALWLAGASIAYWFILPSLVTSTSQWAQ